MQATSKTVNRTEITVVRGDITRQEVEAIVNAANSSLMGGGGVDGAIHRAGGPAILSECQEIRARQGGCPAGEAVITGGGNLPAGHVIHTVGPVWHGGGSGEPDVLASAYRRSLELAAANRITTIAFPSISTGAYGYPVDEAAAVALSVVKSFCQEEPAISEIRFVLFDDRTYEAYRQALASA